MYRSALWLPALAGALLLASCDRDTIPSSPSADSAASAQLGTIAAPANLGLYRLTGDLDTLSFEFSRIDRSVRALGDSFAVDITTLSESTLKFTGIDLPSPTVLRLSMSWEHPLPSTATRRDLSVFDLRAHVLTSNAQSTSFAGAGGIAAPTGAAGVNEALVLADIDLQNADGWSTWGDEVVEPVLGALAPSCYPFVLIHQDDARGPVDPVTPAGWNVVPQAPGAYPFDLDLGIQTGTSLDIMVALDASYGASAMKSIPNPNPGSRLNPRYLNPEFNQKEAWRVSAAVSGPVEGGNSGDSTTLTLAVLDHQIGLSGSGAFNALTDPITSIRYDSDLSSATVAIPGALTTALTVNRGSFTGAGTPSDPLTAAVVLTGDQITGAPDSYLGVVAFVDEMRAIAGATSPLPTLGYDRASQIQTRYDFASYALFELEVEPFVPPVGTWTAVHDIIMNGDSATGASACMMCHASGSGGLFMDSNSLATYNNLVNVMSSCGNDYIEPGNPALSFLYEKVSQTTPSCGLRMPQNGPPYLSAGKIALIQSWILSGAPNN